MDTFCFVPKILSNVYTRHYICYCGYIKSSCTWLEYLASDVSRLPLDICNACFPQCIQKLFLSSLKKKKKRDKCINRGKGGRHAAETAQLGIAKVLSFFQHPQCGPCISGWASAERQPTYLWNHILPMKGSFEHGHQSSPIPHVPYQAPCSADCRRAPFKMCSHAVFLLSRTFS